MRRRAALSAVPRGAFKRGGRRHEAECAFLTRTPGRSGVVKPVLENAGDVFDSSESFVRPVKLLEAAGHRLDPSASPAGSLSA